MTVARLPHPHTKSSSYNGKTLSHQKLLSLNMPKNWFPESTIVVRDENLQWQGIKRHRLLEHNCFVSSKFLCCLFISFWLKTNPISNTGHYGEDKILTIKPSWRSRTSSDNIQWSLLSLVNLLSTNHFKKDIWSLIKQGISRGISTHPKLFASMEFIWIPLVVRFWNHW
jgi:hypothetical protein